MSNTTKTDFAAEYEANMEDLGTYDPETKKFTIVWSEVIDRFAGLFTKTVETIRDNRDKKVTPGVKIAEKFIAENVETATEADNLADEVREVLFRAISENLDLSVLLPNLLRTITTEVTDVRKIVLDGLTLVSETDENEENDVDEADLLARAKFLKEKTELFLSGSNLSLDDLPKNLVRTTKNKKGETIKKINIPNMPSAAEKNEADEKNEAKTVTLSYFLNDKPLPARMGPDRIAFFCSTFVDRINGGELRTRIEKENGGKSWGSIATPVTVTVPAGDLRIVRN